LPLDQDKPLSSAWSANDEIRPLEYFTQFFSLDILSDIVDQNNLYSTQVRGQSLATTTREITDFFSILLLMGIMQLPSYEDYLLGQWHTSGASGQCHATEKIQVFEKIYLFQQ
jgi:hypothetical protein